MQQLLLFEEPIEQKQEKEIIALKERMEKQRKAQWQEISTLRKELKDLRSQLEFINSKICKGGLFL